MCKEETCPHCSRSFSISCADKNPNEIRQTPKTVFVGVLEKNPLDKVVDTVSWFTSRRVSNTFRNSLAKAIGVDPNAKEITTEIELPIEEAIFAAMWGTHGISGKEPLKWVRLVDCSSEHLAAILRTQHQITDGTKRIIEIILNRRKYL